MFNLKKQFDDRRLGEIKVRNKILPTPFYFPVGTVGAVKSVAPWELIDLGFEGILANTYHLYLRPGEKLIKKAGGLHGFMGWPRIILTDSGGFQVFSLGSKKNNTLVKIKDDGVEFTSHIDGGKHFFTPQIVIDIQLALGSDIIMPLDICPPGQSNKKYADFAAAKSLEWLKIAKIYFDQKMKNIPKGKRPLLFGIIQGSTYLDLRKKYTAETIKLDLDGYAIGGLAVGESKTKMWPVVKLMNQILPKDRPRYLMGVGEPADFIKAVNLGIDFVDCVLPTRLARHGIAYKINESKSVIPTICGERGRTIYGEHCRTKAGIQISHHLSRLVRAEVQTEVRNDNKKYSSSKAQAASRSIPNCHPEPASTSVSLGGRSEESQLSTIKLDLRKKAAREDLKVIDKDCPCLACANNLSVAYLAHLYKENEILGHRLITIHNLATIKRIINFLRKQ